jgi:hypothetical protein
VNTQGQITIRQWFKLPGAERGGRAQTFRDADEALQAYEPPGREEDETYLRLNGRVNDLWPTVPWWIRAPALPHPGSRRGAALYVLGAVAVLVVTVMIVLSLSGCSAPCSGHGGVSWYAADWYHCNDGTKEFG